MCPQLQRISKHAAPSRDLILTEIALISGCSLSPSAQLWRKLPASRHKLAHVLENRMVGVVQHGAET